MNLRGYVIFTVCFLLASGTGWSVMPVATWAPGDLQREEVPQFIFVTFDDAVNPDIYEMIGRISNHRHADGSPVGFTFFVSTDWTDYYLVHRLHAAGHEIAAHTITHTTGRGTDFLTWIREIEGCREALHRFAGVPLEQIRGFRAPFLAYNPYTYEALHALGFCYSTSVSEPLGKFSVSPQQMIWPYTLHDGLQQVQWTGTGPEKSLPELMEIPMWLLFERDGSMHPKEMDPAGTRESLVDLFKHNFLQRYEGNRVPLGIWLHAAPWLGNPTAPLQENVDALNEFLEWALQKPNVWVVGMSTVVDWMRNPIPAAQAAAEGRLSPRVFEPIPESQAITSFFGKGGVRTTGNRPLHYPTPETAFLRSEERLTEVTNVELEVVINQIWSTARPSGFQGQIHIRNNSDKTIEQWEVFWTPGNFSVSGMWGDADKQDLPDGRFRIHHGWRSPSIAPGAVLTATFGGSGYPENPGSLAGSFTARVTEKPRFQSGLRFDSSGVWHLNWDRFAPIYHLQRATNPVQGPWETFETVFGRTSAHVPGPSTDEPSVFFRILAEY